MKRVAIMAESIDRRTPIQLRASRLPLTMACSASLVDDGSPRLARDNELAKLGTAAHLVVTDRIAGRYNDADIDEIAARFMVDPGELGMLVGRAWSIWNLEMKAFFAAPQVEEYLSFSDDDAGLLLTGHADIISTMALESERQARIADIKTGFRDDDHGHQLRAYAFLAIQKWPTAETVYAAVIRPREGTRDGWVWTREELYGWYAELLAKLAKRNEYNPDPRWCGICPRGLSCPAKGVMLSNALSLLLETTDQVTGLDPVRLTGLPADPVERGTMLAALKDRAKAITDACEFAMKLVKIEVAEAGGRLPTDDGRELVIVEQTQRQIVPAKAWDILAGTIGEGVVLEECVSISKGDVEVAVKRTAGKGMKGKVVAELMERLATAGAIEEKVIARLETKKLTTKIGVTA